MPFEIIDTRPRWRRLLGPILFRWSQLPLPRRCMECRRVTTGNVEGITRVRFHICNRCLLRDMGVDDCPEFCTCQSHCVWEAR